MSFFDSQNPGLDLQGFTLAEQEFLENFASLGDPGADRIVFWDESANSLAYLTLGTNLSITNTTLNASGGGGSGDVTKVGTPVNNQVGVWTGDGTIEGDVSLTFDTSTDTLATVNLSLSVMTAGSVLFAGTAGLLSQDNANFFFDDSVNQLRIGTITSYLTSNSQIGFGVIGNNNSYYGQYIQNKNAGDSASSDLIIGADNDTTAIAGHYGDFGIQSSGFVGSATGVIKTVSIDTAGTGYTAGDVVSNVANGDGNAQITILTVNGGGGATSISIFDNGSGYSVASALAVTGGTGSGFKFNVLTLYDYTGFVANDIYLLGVGGNLVLATDDTVAGKTIKFFVGGFGTTNNVGEIGLRGYTGKSKKRVTTAADATSITPNTSSADVTYQLNTQATGTLTINADAGTGQTEGQGWILKIKSTNVQTFAFNAQYIGGTNALPTVSSGSSKKDWFTFMWDSIDSKWVFTGSQTTVT